MKEQKMWLIRYVFDWKMTFEMLDLDYYQFVVPAWWLWMSSSLMNADVAASSAWLGRLY